MHLGNKKKPVWKITELAIPGRLVTIRAPALNFGSGRLDGLGSSNGGRSGHKGGEDKSLNHDLGPESGDVKAFRAINLLKR